MLCKSKKGKHNLESAKLYNLSHKILLNIVLIFCLSVLTILQRCPHTYMEKDQLLWLAIYFEQKIHKTSLRSKLYSAVDTIDDCIQKESILLARKLTQTRRNNLN